MLMYNILLKVIGKGFNEGSISQMNDTKIKSTWIEHSGIVECTKTVANHKHQKNIY